MSFQTPRFGFLAAAILTFLAGSGFVSAQGIAMSGTVTESGSGAAVEGASVLLKTAGISVLTNQNGEYFLTGILKVRNSKRSVLSQASFSGGQVRFRLAEDGSRVSVNLHHLSGRLVKTVLDQKMERGSYSLGIDFSSMPLQMCILRVNIQGESREFMVPGSMLGTMAEQSGLSISGGEPSLAKMVAVDDTLIVTKAGYSTAKTAITAYEGTHDFQLTKTSGWDGDEEAFWGDVNSYPIATNVMTYVFLNKTGGQFSDEEIFWQFGGQKRSLAEQNYIDMPANSSGRVNFYMGSENSQTWDFIEHTIGGNSWNGNTTRVDFLGFPIAIRLICANNDRLLGEKYELFFMTREERFQAFKDAVPEEFVHLAEAQAPYRIVAPAKNGEKEFLDNGMYGDYYDEYVASVGGTATTANIFQCAGPMGADPKKCAAYNRHVAELSDAEQRDPANFYLQAPASFYAKWLHENSFDGKSYGFAYDDYAEQAAFASCSDPQYLLVALGY